MGRRTSPRRCRRCHEIELCRPDPVKAQSQNESSNTPLQGPSPYKSCRSHTRATEARRATKTNSGQSICMGQRLPDCSCNHFIEGCSRIIMFCCSVDSFCRLPFAYVQPRVSRPPLRASREIMLDRKKHRQHSCIKRFSSKLGYGLHWCGCARRPPQ
jgi:hypothetical protein